MPQSDKATFEEELAQAEADFIRLAKPYIVSEGITYKELLAKGISKDVLEAAGIRPDESN